MIFLKEKVTFLLPIKLLKDNTRWLCFQKIDIKNGKDRAVQAKTKQKIKEIERDRNTCLVELAVKVS